MSARCALISTPALAAATASVAILLAVSPAAVAQPACAHLPPAQQAMADAWQQPAIQVTAGRAADTAPLLAVGRRARVALLPARNIPLLKTSRPRPLEAAHHGGLMRFQVESSGQYAVASAARVWIELMPDGAEDPLATGDIDRALRCAGIHKALSYRLEAGRRYVLQISEAAEAQVDVLVQPLAAEQAPAR